MARLSYSFRLFKVIFKCLMCMARSLPPKCSVMWNVMNYYTIFITFRIRARKTLGTILFFSGGNAMAQVELIEIAIAVFGSKLHVIFKFMDISHEFVIDKRIAFLLCLKVLHPQIKFRFHCCANLNYLFAIIQNYNDSKPGHLT